MIAIFAVSSLSNPRIGGETPDYILHALEYFLLALLLMRLFLAKQFQKKGGRIELTSWQRASLLGLIIAIGYGISDELHQYFVPGRHCSFHDVFTDTVGALLAYGVASVDYLFLKRCRTWIAFLTQFKILCRLSYALYRFEQR